MKPEPSVHTGKAGPTTFSVQGAGEAVVLVHGVGMAREVWAPQMAVLSRHYKVVSYDMLGHGESELPPEDVTLAAYAEQLLRLMDHLGIGAASIVGHSMGALIALEFALTHPMRTLRVAALNAMFERTDEQRAAVQSRAAALHREGPDASVAPTLERWFGHPVPAALQEPAALTERLLKGVNRIGYARAYRVFAQSDRVHAERLAALAMPALFLTGEQDLNSNPAMSAAMARRAPHADLAVVPGARHMMSLTHAQIVSQTLLAFLRRDRR